MRHLMTAALALVLMSGTSALADPPDNHKGQSGGHAAPSGGGHPGGPPAGGGAPHAAPGGGGGAGGAHAYPGASQGAAHTYGGAAGATHSSGGYQGYSGGAHGAQGGAVTQGTAHGGYSGASHTGQGGAQGYAGGAHGARGVPSTYNPRFGAPGFRPGPGAARPHYDAQYFPRVFQPDHQYAWRGRAWAGQPGYYYRHWGYGDRLPYGWFAAQWFINDYYDYDLPVPPDGYEWIRVGPDALLVDLDDGTVVESVYGLFY